MSKLFVSENLKLPIDTVTQIISILGKTRSGKSHTAGVIVEEVLKAEQQVVVLDPKGDWWGLRSSADGKSAGLPIRILGGKHGDIPLEPTAGALIADDGTRLLLTEEGRAAAPPSDLELTNEKILDRCISAVEDLSGKQLRYLHSVHPNWVSREDLAQELGMSLSGHFKNCFYDLHKAGMIEYGSGDDRMKLKCADWLFLNLLVR